MTEASSYHGVVTTTRLAVHGVSGLGLVTLLTGALAALTPRAEAPPDLTPEQLDAAAGIELPSPTELRTCVDADVTSIVVRGRITSLDPGMQARFHIRLADIPSRYAAVTGDDGRFEVRIPRSDLGTTDLCALPINGLHPATSAFSGSNMTVSYQVSFEH